MSYPPQPPGDNEGNPADFTPPPPPPPAGQTPYPQNPYPQAPYGQAPAYGYGQVPQANKKALWAMILGIVGLFCGIAGIVAIILGFIARGEIRQSNGAQTGSGQALAGIVLGIVSLVAGIAYVALVANS